MITVEAYVADMPIGGIVEDICEVLEDFHSYGTDDDGFLDEYAYYEAILLENHCCEEEEERG